MRIKLVVGSLLIATLSTAACGDEPNEQRRYNAKITRTTDNVPHIVADDVGSLGFGLGYVTAEDHLCKVADGVLWGRSEFSRYHGPGNNDINVQRDLTYKAAGLYERARRAIDHGDPEVLERLRGFAAGYNAYLAKVGPDGVRGWCRGGQWLKPIDEYDLAAFHTVLGTGPTIGPFASMIAGASPPGEASASTQQGRGSTASGPPPTMPAPSEDGSNAWAIGRDRSANGTALLMGNSHLSWEDRLHYYEVHLTIPGKLNAYGATIVGFPEIVHGFNEHTAWSITVSSGHRFTAYLLELVPGSPTSYVYGNETRQMTSTDVSVDVLRDDGTVESVSRTMWSSHYGPIVSFPGLGWSEGLTLTLRDGNEGLSAGAGLFQKVNQAKDIAGVVEAHRVGGGTIAFNTIAADDQGEVWFGDTSATPNLSEEAIAAWRQRLQSDPITQIAYSNRVVLLEGANPRDEWVDDPAGMRPGLVPFAKLPQLKRTDYVFNANDSYRWTNAESPLTGYSPLNGDANTISNRTRMNALQLSQDAGGAGADGLFNLEEIIDSALANRVVTAEVLVDQLVKRCTAEPMVELDGRSVSLVEPCQVLAAWDRKVNLDSRGAILWREFVTGFNSGDLFADEMDPANFLNTPAVLAESPAVLVHLAEAARTLQQAGHALDVAVGEVQFAYRGGTKVPVHGGAFGTGVTNRVNYRPSDQTSEPASPAGELVAGSKNLRTDGYPISGGTTYLLAVELTKQGPKAAAIVAYGNTGDSTSPHYVSQTQRFSEKNWRTVVFTEAAVAAETTASYSVAGVQRPQ